MEKPKNERMEKALKEILEIQEKYQVGIALYPEHDDKGRVIISMKVVDFKDAKSA